MDNRISRRRILGTAAAGVAASAIGGPALAQATPPKVKVATLKQASLTNAWVARQQGMFQRQGLDVELVEFRSGNEAIAAQRGGHVDIILSIPGTAMAANEKGFDLVLVGQNETSKATPPDSGALLVLNDSPIASLKDLEGRKIALSNLRSQKHVAVMKVLKGAGLDPAKAQFVELPYNNHADALKAKQIDVSASLDPWTTQMRTSGLAKVLAWDYVASVPEQPIGAWYVRADYARRNKEVIDKFAAAIRESIDFMRADEARARQMVSGYTGLALELMKDMPINNWSYRIDLARWQATADMMHEFGGLTKAHKAEEYLSEFVAPYVTK